MPSKAMIFCHAEERDGKWEAFCLDFDLAVQGGSFDEVRRKLDEQISLFLESVANLPESDQMRLLRRRAPLSVWLRPLVNTARLIVSARIGRSCLQHDYTVPMRGYSLVA